MKKRLVTRSDFDGLVCAMLLRELDIIGDIKFVHPKDVQDGKIDISENDITTNLPFDKRVGLAFDHHESELIRNKEEEYRGKYIIEGDLDPKDWVLMNFLMDARTGLGRFHNFRISNYDLMMELIDYCVDHSIKQVLELPDVKERVDLYFEQQELFKEQLKNITKIHDKVAVIDLRNEDVIYAGNRFMVYAMWPEVELSVHVAWGFRKQNTAVMIGKSIINRSSDFNIGELCLSYGGGGHANAGTCQLENDQIDSELPIIIDKLNGKIPV